MQNFAPERAISAHRPPSVCEMVRPSDLFRTDVRPEAERGDIRQAEPVTSLASSPCRQICVWRPTEEHIGAMALFRCDGCGSEWTRDQPWRPADSDGQRARQRAQRAQPSRRTTMTVVTCALGIPIDSVGTYRQPAESVWHRTDARSVAVCGHGRSPGDTRPRRPGADVGRFHSRPGVGAGRAGRVWLR